MIQEKEFWCTWILRVHLHGQGVADRHITPVADVRATLGARRGTCQELDVITHLCHSGLGEVLNDLKISWTSLSSAAQHHGTPDNTHILVLATKTMLLWLTIKLPIGSQTTSW